MNANEIGLLLGVVAPFFIAIAGYCVAKKRNRKGWLWFIICLFSGLLGLIVVACSKTLDYDEELDFQESETLGWVMLIIAIIWLIICIYFGFMSAKAQHEQIMWNSVRSIMNM